MTFTLLLPESRNSKNVRAVTFTAETADNAVELIRQLGLPDTCELWADGIYVCSLKATRGRNTSWFLLSAE
jgi:hypothetical protein